MAENMKSNLSNPGGNNKGRMVKFPQQGRAMAESTPGGIILPSAEAAKRAKELASMYVEKLMAWCPVLGAHELPNKSECQWRPLPIPPHTNVLYFKCVTCGQVHMVAAVLVPRNTVPAADVEEAIPITIEDVEANATHAGEACKAIWSDVAAFHVLRTDYSDPIGRTCSKLVITAVDTTFSPCDVAQPVEGSGSVSEVLLDGDDKADLSTRIDAYRKGLEATAPAYFGEMANCKKLWEGKK